MLEQSEWPPMNRAEAHIHHLLKGDRYECMTRLSDYFLMTLKGRDELREENLRLRKKGYDIPRFTVDFTMDQDIWHDQIVRTFTWKVDPQRCVVKSRPRWASDNEVDVARDVARFFNEQVMPKLLEETLRAAGLDENLVGFVLSEMEHQRERDQELIQKGHLFENDAERGRSPSHR